MPPAASRGHCLLEGQWVNLGRLMDSGQCPWARGHRVGTGSWELLCLAPRQPQCCRASRVPLP